VIIPSSGHSGKRSIHSVAQQSYLGDNKDDIALLERMEREGSLARMSMLLDKWRKMFVKHKFIFKIDPRMMVNIVACVYGIDREFGGDKK